MSLNATISPRPIAFSGNPIKISIESSHPVTYTVKHNNIALFEGSIEAGTEEVFIDEILTGIVSPTRFTEEREILIPIESNKTNFSVAVSNENNEVITLTNTVLLGGISKRAMRNLNDQGSNIFTFKLLNPAGNFFMTTRSERRIITLRETEVYPLLFIAPAASITVKAAEGIIRTFNLVENECYALNIDALRYSFFTQESILSNYFEISTDEGTILIVIEPAAVEKNRYYLDFLNSYGAYERVEITGIPELGQEQEEDRTFGKYDPVVNDYVEHRERVSTQNSLRVQTGFKSENELIFILDMLSSDDIRLIGYEDREIKVNVTAESLAVAKRLGKPQSISLLLNFADKETHFTHALFGDDFDNPRIHTEQFSKEFN